MAAIAAAMRARREAEWRAKQQARAQADAELKRQERESRKRLDERLKAGVQERQRQVAEAAEARRRWNDTVVKRKLPNEATQRRIEELKRAAGIGASGGARGEDGGELFDRRSGGVHHHHARRAARVGDGRGRSTATQHARPRSASALVYASALHPAPPNIEGWFEEDECNSASLAPSRVATVQMIRAQEVELVTEKEGKEKPKDALREDAGVELAPEPFERSALSFVSAASSCFAAEDQAEWMRQALKVAEMGPVECWSSATAEAAWRRERRERRRQDEEWQAVQGARRSADVARARHERLERNRFTHTLAQRGEAWEQVSRLLGHQVSPPPRSDESASAPPPTQSGSEKDDEGTIRQSQTSEVESGASSTELADTNGRSESDSPPPPPLQQKAASESSQQQQKPCATRAVRQPREFRLAVAKAQADRAALRAAEVHQATQRALDLAETDAAQRRCEATWREAQQAREQAEREARRVARDDKRRMADSRRRFEQARRAQEEEQRRRHEQTQQKVAMKLEQICKASEAKLANLSVGPSIEAGETQLAGAVAGASARMSVCSRESNHRNARAVWHRGPQMTRSEWERMDRRRQRRARAEEASARIVAEQAAWYEEEGGELSDVALEPPVSFLCKPEHPTLRVPVGSVAPGSSGTPQAAKAAEAPLRHPELSAIPGQAPRSEDEQRRERRERRRREAEWKQAQETRHRTEAAQAIVDREARRRISSTFKEKSVRESWSAASWRGRAPPRAIPTSPQVDIRDVNHSGPSGVKRTTTSPAPLPVARTGPVLPSQFSAWG